MNKPFYRQKAQTIYEIVVNGHDSDKELILDVIEGYLDIAYSDGKIAVLQDKTIWEK